MAGVLKRTSNSVEVGIVCSTNYEQWQKITVGGSVIFQWVVQYIPNSDGWNYFIRFSKKIPSDKVDYIVKYTHWKVMDKMRTAVISIRTDHFGAIYCPAFNINGDEDEEVTVEISTDQTSSCAIIYDDTELTDFILRGEDGSVPFHKVVLAAHSSEFKSMLAGIWKDTSEGVIDVSGTSEVILQYLKKYMHLGKLPGEGNEQVEYIKQLLLLSLYYSIEDLTLRCIKELRLSLTIENVSDMIQFAIENKEKRLLLEIIDSVVMGDIDKNEVRNLVEAEYAANLM